MRLAALITVFNGLELLDKAIENILKQVDEIIIAYQDVSNKGNLSNDVFPAVRKYIGMAKFTVVKFEPVPGINTKDNERSKHNLLLEQAKKLHCTHFLFMATDHFYLPEEFAAAKQQVRHDVTFTAMYTYYKNVTWQLTPIEEYYMPFICKLYPETQVTKCRSAFYPCRVDPALMINTCATYRILSPELIMLHHYSMIRNDIRNKFANAAASIRWKPEQVQGFIDEYENYNPEENKGITYFQGRKVKVVADYFGLVS